MPDLTKRNFKLGIGTQLDYQLAYINSDFENVVISHIVGNYMNHSSFPLYLSIHGKKGEGKTFQTLRVCSKYRVSTYYISGAELCGSYEKDSIGAIEENLNKALHDFQTTQEMSVFIIDDFHLSIASTELGVGKTVNSQILTGFLMNLADKAKATKNARIPIILLGNDFNNLYDPLTRDGRMDFFEWNPTLQEKISIVCSHFDDIVFHQNDKEKLIKLITKYDSQPISFFAEVKNDLSKNIICDYLRLHSQLDIRTLLYNINQLSIQIENNNESCIPTIESCIEKRLNNLLQKTITHEERGKLHNA